MNCIDAIEGSFKCLINRFHQAYLEESLDRMRDGLIPYMKSKAESFANMVLDNTLNAIIVLDEGLLIQEFNPAAEKMFLQSADLVKNSHLNSVIANHEILRCVSNQEKIVGRRVELPYAI